MSYQITCYTLDEVPKDADIDLLGGKGYHLATMHRLHIPVPAAIIIPTTVCQRYMHTPKEVMWAVEKVILPKIKKSLRVSSSLPLLSVRSGAKFSMPGMMDTVLNVGLDTKTYKKWEKKLGWECAQDCYRKLVEMYACVVNRSTRSEYADLSLEDSLKKYEADFGSEFPRANEQLLNSIEAVFKSWNNDRAKTYRKLNNIPDDLGTAVIIQAMVFGNLNKKSCTGVLFSRNPSTGENLITGEFLVQAQGEDVVAGTRTPQPLSGLEDWNSKIADTLHNHVSKLESFYKDMQDVEFTVENGKLFILQCRSGKRTAKASIRIAVDMLEEKVLTKAEAIKKVTYAQYLTALRPTIDPAFELPPDAIGIPASIGIVTGRVVFSSKEAVTRKDPCILLATETTPDDIAGINAAVGILTSTGGATSHAAVVARGMDKVCVVGCSTLKFDGLSWSITINDSVCYLDSSTKITLDGETGRVWINSKVPVLEGINDPYIKRFTRLLHDGQDYYRISTDPKMVGSSKSWFPLYCLEDLSLKDVHTALYKVIEAMDEGVIDLRLSHEICEPVDAPFYSMLGMGQTRKGWVENVIMNLPTVEDKKIWLLGIPPHVLGAPLGKSLKKRGYKVMPIATTVEDLIISDGLSLAGNVQASPAVVEKIMYLKAKAGEPESLVTIYSGEGDFPESKATLLAMTDLVATKVALSS